MGIPISSPLGDRHDDHPRSLGVSEVTAPHAAVGLARTPPVLPPRLKRIVLALVALTGVTGVLGTALSPYLLVENPLLLVGLNPDSRHLVLAAAHTELWQVVAVAAPRRAINFIATYGLGSLYGYVAVGWIERRHPWLKRVVRLGEMLYLRLGTWLVLLVPIYSIAGLAGFARMPLWKYALAIIPGQLAFVAGVFVFGESIKQWTTPIIAFLSQHLLASTLLAIALVATQQIYKRWRKAARDES
jgi:membrane protein DedA with SNARE-associated domain